MSQSIGEFARSRRAVAVCIGLIIALSVALGGLIWFGSRSDDTAAQFQDRFQSLRAQELTWDAEIRSLQLGIAPNYDAVTIAARNLKLGLLDLQRLTASDESLKPLLPILDAYAEAIKRKDWLTEQVKASYAMLRNAAAVVPTAVSDAFAQTGVLEPLPGIGKRPADLINEVLAGMTNFAVTPSDLLLKMVRQRISAIRMAAPSFDPALSSAVERLLVQVEVEIRERQRGNQLILAVASAPTSSAADRVQETLQSLAARRAESRGRLWDLTVLLGALLVLAVLVLVAILWGRFAQLDKDHRVLKQVNQNAEEQLMQSAKLSALGQMVAGITHEINTPLAYVKAVFELIKERIQAEPPRSDGSGDDNEEAVREWQEELQILLDDGLHGLDEITTLVRTMKNFSRLDKGTIESFSVEEGIESALLIARPQLKYVADIKREFDSVPTIMGSPSQLRQVLLNLIVNAADAMKGMDRRGVLTVRTRLTSSDTVQIDVCDNGSGIPEDIAGRIFDPFFTTKAVGEGSGMGLSICYRIIENHGGTIAVNSKPGKGTVFTIVLPRQGEHFPQPGNNADSVKGPAASSNSSDENPEESRAA